MKIAQQLNYIDIHSHLNFAAYDGDRQEVIDRAKKLGVGMINVGTQIDTSRKAMELAENNENMWATVGLHPIHTQASHHDKQELGEGGKEFTSRGEIPDTLEYAKMAMHKKVVAIGECGLDYYRLEKKTALTQAKIFESMVGVANKVKKPLMLHIRNGSGKSAYDDAYNIVKKKSEVLGNLHFFAGNMAEAKQFLDIGFYFSFTGVITFTRDYDEIIKYIPLNRIMSETDCPYVTPIPHRGKRNEPSYVIEVIKAIARIKNQNLEQMERQILENARRFFAIESSEVPPR